MCWEAWSDHFIWSWMHQFFMVNLWCPYFKMYPVWTIYQQCNTGTCTRVVLPVGWCSFLFYLVSRSRHCSCYLCWNCCILLLLLVLGGFSDKVSLLLDYTLGGVLYPCYDEFCGGGTCGGLFWCTVKWFSCVMVNLMFLYPAEMMNLLVTCWLDFTRWAMAGEFYSLLALGATESLQI